MMMIEIVSDSDNDDMNKIILPVLQHVRDRVVRF